MKQRSKSFAKSSRIWKILISGKSHSPENPEESFILAKRFVSRKSEGGFDENKLEKSRIEKMPVFEKTDIACWA